MRALQAQRNIQEVVFGPYETRRFGRSLGVNPLPRGSKFCNFDCIYCECGDGIWPAQWRLQPEFPRADDVRLALTAAADALGARDVDSITIAGNGEPTLSPDLDAIVDVVTEARDRDWPWARTVILTNGTTCHRPQVRAALARVDERVVKLDAGTDWILQQMNRPAGRLCTTELLRRLSMLPGIIIQSMFVHGPVDNTRPEHVKAWTEWLKRLAPLSVQIYSLDRLPAKNWVREASRDELESIAQYVESNAGIPAHVY